MLTIKRLSIEDAKIIDGARAGEIWHPDVHRGCRWIWSIDSFWKNECGKVTSAIIAQDKAFTLLGKKITHEYNEACKTALYFWDSYSDREGFVLSEVDFL